MLNPWPDEYPEIRHGDLATTGSWAVTVYTDKGTVNITTVRGIQTKVLQMTTTDPFGPASASLEFPALSLLDSIGEGDLWWWRAGAAVDIVWTSDTISFPGGTRNEVRWEGYISGESVSFEDAGGRMEMTLKGALLGCDNTTAVPEYPQRPYTFEYAIARSIDRCRANGLHLGKMVVEWPGWWTEVYRPKAGAKAWMVPVGVTDGEKWTGMVTRETGQFEPTLSNYINGLLQSMHTERGQFTLMLGPGRVPVLRHRERVEPRTTAIIDIATPGLTLDLSCDYESKANVILGRGRGLDGIAFSNMQFTSDGGTAYYLPFAYHRSVHPPRPDHLGGTGGSIRREVSLQFYEGMSAKEAERSSELYRQRFAAAGYVGTMKLTTDPYVQSTMHGRRTYPRHTIVAGDAIRVLHFKGVDSGVLLHVTEAEHDLESGTTMLKVDTVFRDRMTSAEVRARGRDALTDAMMLTTGQYNVNVRDQMLPWGPDSGYMPVTSRKMFDEASQDGSDPFPWEEMTMARPPKDPAWTSSYVHIPPADHQDLRRNWNCPLRNERSTIIQLAQAGSIRLLQVMAVDSDGRRMKVPFHISFYLRPSVCSLDMPKLDNREWPHPLFGVKTGPYPFFPGAWEQINTDGSKPNDALAIPAPDSGIVGGYGTEPVPAGYYPGSPQAGDEPTGLLQVEDAFQWDVAGFQAEFNPHKPGENSFTKPNGASGIAGVMIYCDSMWSEAAKQLVPRDRDVYFIARLFRQPPGNG